jgi:hypothetical protein
MLFHLRVSVGYKRAEFRRGPVHGNYSGIMHECTHRRSIGIFRLEYRSVIIVRKLYLQNVDCPRYLYLYLYFLRIEPRKDNNCADLHSSSSKKALEN